MMTDDLERIRIRITCIAILMTSCCISGYDAYRQHPRERCPTDQKIPSQVPYLSQRFQSNDENYDFIIVGAGSAGSVIANRLSEIGDWKILLLEVGTQGDALTKFPAFAPLLQFTEYNWGYVAEPQSQACLAMAEHRCAWPRGKALGGSSVINYMVYTRGNPADYDRWAALGNTEWSHENVLRYFLKSEKSMLKNANEGYHNTSGYLGVSDAYISNLGNAFISAGKELGYEEVDYNGADQIGFSKIQATIKQGRRHSTASAFLEPIVERQNLKILTEARVTKVLIDPLTKKAYGVEYRRQNKDFKASASKEVILSAGAINSPQLLMLSGIGPKEHLNRLEIATLSDLPVGKTLYDHIAFLGLVITTNLPHNGASPFDPNQLLKWHTTGEGPLSSNGGSEAIAFIKANNSNTYPEIELILQHGNIRIGTLAKKSLRISDEYYNKMYTPLELVNSSFTIVPILLHPKSKGFMQLNSSNPYDNPLIYPNYFTDPQDSDLDTLVSAIRVIMKLLQTNAFKNYGADILNNHFVGCEALALNTDEYWKCALRLMATSSYHPTSTCKMGPTDDPDAVVNQQLKVYGISNLRVVDASVMPLPVSGHTNAPTIMIGEKASDLIKQEWGALSNS